MENPIPSWSQVATFIKQHTHDVRNHLSSLDLEAAYLLEVIGDEAESRECVKRLRAQIHQTATALKNLSAKLSPPKVTRAPLAAKDVFLIWGDAPKSIEGCPEITWHNQLNGESIEVDPISLSSAFHELLLNAVNFSSTNLVGSGRNEAGNVVFELREKTVAPVDPESWGILPFHSTRRGAYGLGLWQARRIIEANGGSLKQSFQPSSQELLTIISFPVL